MSEAIRLVVSDVDGTLVDKQKRLTPATIAAVGRLKAAGIAFTIISARPRSGMISIAETLGLDGPMGAFNGGVVFRRDGTVIRHEAIDRDVVRGMFDLIGDAMVDRWVFADDRWYASAAEGVHVDHERIASAQEPMITQDLAHLSDKAEKLTFVSDDAALLHDLSARATAAFGGKATIVQSQTYYLDVTALAANKGAGIAALAEALGLPLSATAAIGDQANDIAMLERAGLAIAMGNAPDAVKAIAHQITTANDADGVAHAIDTLILTPARSPA